MTEDQLNLLINLLCAVTLFEMMVSIGMGVTFADLMGVAGNGRLIGMAALANYVDRKSTRLNSSHEFVSRMPSSA